jgi:hypothetical protein
MTQFRSHPHHTAIDVVATLIHHIQATHATNNAGVLLLFDISGFFNNLDLDQMAQVLQMKGFPPGVCKWAHTFMGKHKAALKIGDYTSLLFDITHRTPQGSPVSPILSMLFTANLLESTLQWEHSNLTMHMDDGAIYATSQTTSAVAHKAQTCFLSVLDWLHHNGLMADSAKTELMVFTKQGANPDITGGPIHGLQYHDPLQGDSHITTVHSCQMHHIYAHMAVFACARSCFALSS